MARSYIRASSRRKGGILVREAAVARGVPTNSLYSVPVTGSMASAGIAAVVTWTNTTSTYKLQLGSKNIELKVGSAVKLAMIRASSITVASKSPFQLQVLNASGGYTTYEIQGQKPTKITFSRDNSVIGNPALFKSYMAGSSFPALVLTADQEDEVDMKMNLVIDSAYDN